MRRRGPAVGGDERQRWRRASAPAIVGLRQATTSPAPAGGCGRWARRCADHDLVAARAELGRLKPWAARLSIARVAGRTGSTVCRVPPLLREHEPATLMGFTKRLRAAVARACSYPKLVAGGRSRRCLDPGPSRRRLPHRAACRTAGRVAVAAAEQEGDGIVRQVLDRVLRGLRMAGSTSPCRARRHRS